MAQKKTIAKNHNQSEVLYVSQRAGTDFRTDY